MKKKVAFKKEITFPTMIGEVTAISLEPNLYFKDESNVEGNLLLIGKYKLTEASRLEEDFKYQIPIEITFNEKLDLETTKLEISDFQYEIQNEDTMICHIELYIEGLELIEDLNDNRECDDNPLEKEIEIPKIENTVVKQEDSREEQKEENDSETLEQLEDSSLFLNLDSEDEKYGTFLVYIVRQNETIHSIIEKYSTTLEEVEKYNDISNINIGTKLIIPLKNES